MCGEELFPVCDWEEVGRLVWPRIIEGSALYLFQLPSLVLSLVMQNLRSEGVGY